MYSGVSNFDLDEAIRTGGCQNYEILSPEHESVNRHVLAQT